MNSFCIFQLCLKMRIFLKLCLLFGNCSYIYSCNSGWKLKRYSYIRGVHLYWIHAPANSTKSPKWWRDARSVQTVELFYLILCCQSLELKIPWLRYHIELMIQPTHPKVWKRAIYFNNLEGLGEVPKKFSSRTDVEVWIIPTFENSTWLIMAISFISLLAMSAILATCFFVRRHWIRRDRPRNLDSQEFHEMSSQLVKAMASLI